MKLTYFLILFSLSFSVFAQKDFRVVGKIQDEKGKMIEKAKIYIDNKLVGESTANPNAQFAFFQKTGSEPLEVRAEKAKLSVKSWKYDNVKKELLIVMAVSSNRLRGKLSIKGKQAVANATVKIAGWQDSVKTNQEGIFDASLPNHLTINDNSTIFINSIEVPRSNLKFRTEDGYRYVEIEMPKKEDKLHEYVALIMDEMGKPIQNVKVMIEGNYYMSDEEGEFKFVSKTVLKDLIKMPFAAKDCEFKRVETEGTDILKLIFKPAVQLEEVTATTEEEPTAKGFTQDINKIINELELEKQLLATKSIDIRLEIQKITDRLSSKYITDAERDQLRSDMKRLEDALITNEMAYEDAQAKTRSVVDQMRKVIVQKDSLVTVVDETLETAEKTRDLAILEFVIFSIVLILLGIIAVQFYLSARRSKKQKNEVEKAYKNIENLSEIGQKIASTLDFDSLVQTVYTNVNELLDAPVFGVGAYNEKQNTIEFRKFIDAGAVIPYLQENLEDTRKFSVWCFKNQKPLIINDLAVGYKDYLKVDSFPVTPDMPQALIYLPLVSEGGKPNGVVTVQSFKKNAYKEQDITLLKTLASYIAIALENTKAYQVIKEKNKSITDSIRYAKTIQQAMLPSPSEMQTGLTDFFTIYKPKDIVSGDFYWYRYSPSQAKFVVALDCTGHGVPGAFMSMIANSLLNEIINAEKEEIPATILDKMNRRLREILKQDDKINDDGMDVCLCKIDEVQEKKVKVIFSGAKRPLYYIGAGSNEVQALKGDQRSVGGTFLKERTFTNQAVDLQQGDMIYLTSDGLVDQAAPNKDKFGTVRLMQIIKENAQKSTQEQREILLDALQNHQQSAEQRDDIMVIGIRV